MAFQYPNRFDDPNDPDGPRGPGDIPPPAAPTAGPAPAPGFGIPLSNPTQEPSGSGHGGGGGGGGGPVYTGPISPDIDIPGAPTFVAPTFNAPNMESLQNDPGYQLRLASGSNALQRSAAARGVLRTGGTLKDIVDYGQKFGSDEYGRAFDRARGVYDTQYQGAAAAFAPRLAQWQQQAAAAREAALAQFQRQWDMYTFANRPRSGGGGGAPVEIEPPPSGDWENLGGLG